MPSYLRPGVYVEESLTPLTSTLSIPGEASAAFIGTHSTGPNSAVKVSSWSQFVGLYGGFGVGTNELPFAVYQFFANGGRATYVVRTVADDATSATVTLQDRQPSAKDVVVITATAAGASGNSVTVTVTDGPVTGRFDFAVASGASSERFLDVSLNPIDARYLPSLVNSPTAGSKFVSVEDVAVDAWTSNITPETGTATLASATNGQGAANLLSGLNALDEVDETLVVNLPGVVDTSILNQVTAWCESRGTAFHVIDVPQAEPGATTAQTLAAYQAFVGALSSSSYRATYGPNLIVQDPVSTTRGAVRTLPAGSAVVGKYSATDATVGVQKAAAGTTTGLAGVLATDVKFTPDALGTLNRNGINVIKSVPGSGFCIFGARTGSSGMPDRYVSVRRTLIYLKKALVDGTAWAVFEPNDESLWSTLSANITQFLTSLMQVGVLKGSTAAEAFFVKCDGENNTPGSVGAGEVHIQVGVALNSPAEFVIINIGQYDGSSSVTEA